MLKLSLAAAARSKGVSPATLRAAISGTPGTTCCEIAVQLPLCE
jgi:hypothetical protein